MLARFDVARASSPGLECGRLQGARTTKAHLAVQSGFLRRLDAAGAKPLGDRRQVLIGGEEFLSSYRQRSIVRAMPACIIWFLRASRSRTRRSPWASWGAAAVMARYRSVPPPP